MNLLLDISVTPKINQIANLQNSQNLFSGFIQ